MTYSLEEFVDRNIDKRVVIMGEWHHYIGDAAVVASLVNAFIAKGKRLEFFMEHFPGSGAMRIALNNAIAGNSWHSVKIFLDTAIDTQGKGMRSPMNAWEHADGRAKLEMILRLAQLKGLSVFGHDLPYDDQVTYLTNKEYGAGFEEREKEQMKARDLRMHLQYLSKLNNDNNIDTIFAFVGEQHAYPQLSLTKQYHPCVALIPHKASSVTAGRPIVSTLVAFTEVKPDFYQFC
jgi:hypothetical protein